MSSSLSLFLIGPMGAGKTTLGQMLANHYDLPFFDTDREIEKRTGADVSWIFDQEGEAGFRNREQKMLSQLAEKKQFVIATGGGIVVREANRKLLKQSGLVIYLQMSVDFQLKRLAQDTQRPLIQGVDREQKLKQLSEAREPLYFEAADIIFNVESDDPRKLLRQLVESINQHR